MAEKAPSYDYRADPATPRNQRAAEARGWEWDDDWHDHLDEDGQLVHGRFREGPLDPAALK